MQQIRYFRKRLCLCVSLIINIISAFKYFSFTLLMYYSKDLQKWDKSFASSGVWGDEHTFSGAAGNNVFVYLSCSNYFHFFVD